MWRRALGLLLVAAAAPAPANASPARFLGARTLSQDVRVVGPCGFLPDSFPASGFEPSLSNVPGQPARLAVAWYQGFGSNAVAGASLDGGRHWRVGPVPGLSRCTGGDTEGNADPWVSVGPDGRHYLASIPANTPIQPSLLFFSRIAVSRSDDGTTWSPPAEVSPLGTDFNDKESVTADPIRPGTAYTAWTRRYGANAEHGIGYFSRTDDGGHTWTPPSPVQTVPLPFLTPTNPQVFVDRDGALVQVFDLTNESANIPTRPADFPWQVLSVRSEDGGRSWSEPVLVATLPAFGSSVVFRSADGVPLRTPAISARAQDAKGVVHVAWSAVHSGGGSEVLTSRSPDGGRSWSPPLTVSSAPGLLLQPTIAVAGDGTVGVYWYDLRDDRPGDEEVTTRLRLAHSHDGGATWSESLVGGTFDYRDAPAVGLEGLGASHFLGDYFGMAALPTGFALAYARPAPDATRGRGPSQIRVGRVALAAERLSVAVRPQRVRARRRVRFRFAVSADDGTGRVPAAGALVRFARRRARADSRGRATIVVRLRQRRRYGVTATLPGFPKGRAVVRARR